METENKAAITDALEMIKLNLKQFPNAFLALNGTWGECIKALEKQIPKKPRITVQKYMYHEEEISANFTHCPCCFDDIQLGYFDTLVDKGTPYCQRCGQALDWSEENEM